MGKKRVLISYGVDVDAVAGWLGSYGGEDSTSDISRGIFAGTVGTQRLLKMFKKVSERSGTATISRSHVLPEAVQHQNNVVHSGSQLGDVS